MILLLTLGSLLMPPSFAEDPPAAQLIAQDGGWVVETSRSLGDVSAEGRAAFRGEAPDKADPPHQPAAAGQAWLLVGQRLLEAGRHEEALQAADAGISELGGDYAPIGTRDSTTLKIYAAKDLARSGRIEDAATTTLRMLEERLSLYQQRYGVTLSGE